MEEVNESLFILSIFENKENPDAIINAFNIDGIKLTLRAKGYQKEQSKNRLVFEPFSFVQTEYFNTFGKTKLLKRGDKILNPNKQTKQIIYVKDVIEELLKRESSVDGKVIKLIYYLFDIYNKGLEVDITLLFLLILILKNKNIYFQLNTCVNCGSNKNIEYLLLHKGGVFCNQCFYDERQILSFDFLNKIKFFFNIKSIKELSTVNFDPSEEIFLKEILLNYYENELGYFLKSLKKI